MELLKNWIETQKSFCNAATPGPYEARCREFSNMSPLEIWTEFGWADQLPRSYRQPTYEFFANSISSLPLALKIIERLSRSLQLIAEDSRAAIEISKRDRWQTSATDFAFSKLEADAYRAFAKAEEFLEKK